MFQGWCIGLRVVYPFMSPIGHDSNVAVRPAIDIVPQLPQPASNY